MDVIAILRFVIEEDEWLPAYPGDPLVRPACLRVDLETKQPEALRTWFKEMIPKSVELSCQAMLTRSWDETELRTSLMTFQLPDKASVMLVKLTWPTSL